MLQLPVHWLHRLKQSCRVMVIRFNWALTLQFQYCLLKY